MDSTLTIILMWKLTGNVVVSGSWNSRLNNGVGWRETGWGPSRFGGGLARPSTLAKIQYRLLMPVSMTGEQDPGTLKQFMRDIMSLHPNCSFFSLSSRITLTRDIAALTENCYESIGGAPASYYTPETVCVSHFEPVNESMFQGWAVRRAQTCMRVLWVQNRMTMAAEWCWLSTTMFSMITNTNSRCLLRFFFSLSLRFFFPKGSLGW